MAFNDNKMFPGYHGVNHYWMPYLVKVIVDLQKPLCGQEGRPLVGCRWEAQGDTLCTDCAGRPACWPLGGECYNCDRPCPTEGQFQNTSVECLLCQEEEKEKKGNN